VFATFEVRCTVLLLGTLFPGEPLWELIDLGGVGDLPAISSCEKVWRMALPGKDRDLKGERPAILVEEETGAISLSIEPGLLRKRKTLLHITSPKSLA